MRPYRGAHRKLANLALHAETTIPLPDGATIAKHRRSLINAVTHLGTTRGMKFRVRTDRYGKAIKVKRVMTEAQLQEALAALPKLRI